MTSPGLADWYWSLSDSFRNIAVAVSFFLSLLPAVNSAQSSTDLASMCVAGSGNTGLDITVCSSAIASGLYKDNNLGTIYLARGRAHRLTGECDAAIADFDRAEKLMPYSAAAPARRGLARQCLGDLTAAIAEFDTALSRNPFFPAAWRDRGIAHFFNQSMESAESDLKRALSIDAYDAEAHTFLALCRYVAGDIESASIYFDRADWLGHAWQYLDLWRLHTDQLGNTVDPAFAQLLSKQSAEEQWPAPLLAHYLGHDTLDLTADDSLTAISPDTVERRRMERLFYHLLHSGHFGFKTGTKSDSIDRLLQYNPLPLSVELTLARILSGRPAPRGEQ